MTTPESTDPRQAEADYQALIDSQRTLLLSTVTAAGEPEISYAPYLRDESGRFYIFVSELAAHTRNLRHQGRAAILFIRPEEETRNPFARERVILQCQAEELPAGDPEQAGLLSRMEQRFGETVALLRRLPDFHLFVLTPQTGRYVAGFGKAYDLVLPAGGLRPVTPPD
ncbi:HugZ family protein [Sedimenticola hydrogenitrophicus]|uniref:HugZ family pyridoxamine 5'-phosphate oxidase n=1 Tax=Sedimenticola hydrogenitrophicus TaxID=2967975 RepID=UPI0023B0F9DB|nr:pyridoxamine 5'-phosphate oxidase family protein [Sedimenticola hydrogenitrophicus]